MHFGQACLDIRTDRQSVGKTSLIRRKRFKRLPGERHWRDTHVRRVELVFLSCFVHLISLAQPNRPHKQPVRARHAPQRVILADFFNVLLEDGTTLSLRGKPFSLHLLNESGAVHMKQLSRLARNSVGLSKSPDDEMVLELLELSRQIHPLIVERNETRLGLIG